MNRLSKIVIFTSMLFLSISIPLTNMAQPPDPGCNDEFGNPLPPDDPRCPIDGGVTVLIAAGAGLGLLRKKRKI